MLVSRDVTKAIVEDSRVRETNGKSQPTKRAVIQMNTRAQRKSIRSVGVTKINSLVKVAGDLEKLMPAFAEWNAGEIFLCKKTQDFRYRYGHRSKSTTPWNSMVRGYFATLGEFAFAAMVFDQQALEVKLDSPIAPAPVASVNRVNVISMITGEAVA